MRLRGRTTRWPTDREKRSIDALQKKAGGVVPSPHAGRIRGALRRSVDERMD